MGFKAIVLSALAAIAAVESSADGESTVTGVVTVVIARTGNSFVLAGRDDPNGESFYVTDRDQNERFADYEGAAPLASGSIVEVTGERVPLMFKPGMLARRIRLLGSVELPPAPVVELSELRLGMSDNRRVAIKGVVRRVTVSGGFTRMLVSNRQGVARVRVQGRCPSLSRLVDRDVQVTGVAMSEFNFRAEFMDFWIEASGADDVAELEPKPEGHRLEFEGQVVAVGGDGAFYVCSDGRGMKVVSNGPRSPRVGERVRVKAFPDRERGVVVYGDADWTVLAPPSPVPAPEPLMVAPNGRLMVSRDLAFIDQQFKLVEVKGRCAVSEDGALVVRVGGSVEVRVEGPAVDRNAVDEAALGPLATVRGICELEVQTVNRDGKTFGDVLSVRVLTSSPDDVKLVRDSTYRAAYVREISRHLFRIVLLVLAVALVAVVWVRLRERRERMKRRAIEADRKRIAADLHDTVEQYLACAKMVMSGAATKGGMPEDVRKAFEVAADVLAQAKREVRDAVMNLRVDAASGTTLAEMLKATAARVSKSGAVEVRTKLRGIGDDFTGPRMLDAAAIVNEAITNAIKHGRAKNVIVVSDPAAEGGFVLRVRNDGEAFDPSKAVGPETGHFGLSGMRERAKRIGAALAIESVGGWTEVRLCVKGMRSV